MKNGLKKREREGWALIDPLREEIEPKKCAKNGDRQIF
jgi:hypothetical protein